MDWLINGLPLHPLIVHFVVIVVPLAALCLLLSAFWPAARKRLGIVTPIVALAALISIPLAEQAGEALEEQVAETALTEIHTDLGESLLPWAIALFLVAAAHWAWYRFFTGDTALAKRVSSPAVRTTVTVVFMVLAVVVAIGAVVMTVIIGESGARAVWGS